MSMKGIFAALAVGAAVIAAPQAAQAEQPLQNCDPSKIFATVADNRGAVKAFGDDLCVYSVIAGRPLAVRNYDQNIPREAQAFAREYETAMAGANTASDYARRQAEAQQRQAEARQRICQQQVGSVIGGILDGRRVSASTIINGTAYCR